MKKFAFCIFAVAFCTPSAFADTAATISRAIPSSASTADTAQVSTRNSDSANRTTVSRQTVTRNAVSASGDSSATSNAPSASNARNTSSTADTGTSASSGATTVRSGSRVLTIGDDGASSPRAGTTVSRTGAASRSVVSSNSSQRGGLDEAVHTVGRNARVSEASINNNPAVRRAGISLRPSTAEVGGRAKIAGTDIQTGSNVANEVRSVTSRATSTSNVATRESIEEAKERLEQTAELNKSCQEQYNECMDQFCAVIDSNQKRCSCSANLSKYTKVEEAVKDANTQLNEVAQRIRYVGLSADEIRAIMNATEAEEALSGTTDTTETRNMLEEIEKLIRDPSSATSYSADTYSGLDMSLDFSSDTLDIFNLDFLNTNTSSFSNLRGTELYNAAKKRCNSVLTQCKEVGATTQQITGNYDLAIDKDCIAYEQGLTKMNETLVSNVRSANLMLQKARLAVLQNKNQYDAKGCIAALDACMTDDMVCGADYTKCLDPTKRYIDENGEVVLGQDITDITDFMKEYNNSAIDKTFLQSAYNSQSINTDSCKASASGDKTGGNDGSCIVKYLMQKIGTKQKVTDEGLCRAVLDKCQAYTYDSNGNYNAYNDVVVNYVQRAMVNIKAAQQQIISDYASTCMVDIANCYNQQVTQVNAWSSSASVSSVYNVMRGACRNVALTCAYAVFANDADSCPTNTTNGDDTCIESISSMFYQSLLCPDNSTYVQAEQTVSSNGTEGGYVNNHCKCNSGYDVWGGACLMKCPANASRNTYGTCVCDTGYTMKNSMCEPSTSSGNQ